MEGLRPATTATEIAVFERMTESVAICDRDGRVRYLNPAAERLFGSSVADVIGETLWVRMPSSMSEVLRDAFERVVATNRRVSVELHALSSSMWHESEIFVVDDGVCVIARDVTARKLADSAREELLARTLESEALFRTLGDAVPDLLWVSDAAGRPLYQNPAWRAYTGMTPDDLAREGWEALHLPDELEQHRRMWAAAQQDGASITAFEGRLRRHDGAFRWFSGKTVPFKDEGGTLVRWVGILTEIHDRREAEQRLRESEERLALERERLAIALRTGALGVYEWTLGAPEVWWSPETYPVYGVDPNTFRPTLESFSALVHPDDRDELWRKTEESIARREVFLHEYRVVAPDGRVRWILNQSRVRLDAEGRPLGLTGVAAEITERKAAEQALKKSEEALLDADRRKDEFLATLAHELRNPLAPIRSGVAILSTEAPREPKRVLQMMDRQVGHMVRLIDDLLDVSRVSRGKITLKKERVALQSIVESAVDTSRPIIDAGKHRMTVSMPDAPVWLHADPTRVAQVLSNLLNNAAKYTRNGGRITLTADVRADRVVLSVSDTGVGIASDMLPRVFELFTQVGGTLDRAQGGLGIGLSLARKLVELHDGTIVAQSDGLDRGSTFIVELPMGSPVETAPSRHQSTPARSGLTFRVLIVDDNEDAADALAMLLEAAGHETKVEHDGPSAIAVAPSFRPDVVFLDIGLPGMSGYEVAQHLKRETFEQPHLVAVTGWGTEEDRQRSERAGFDVHLTKPVERRVVEELLAQVAAIRLATNNQ